MEPAWERDWAVTVAAAKAEGKVAVLTLTGSGYRRAMDAFEAAFPGIEVEHEGPASMGPFSQKIIQERKAGIFSRDVAQISTITALSVLRPEGVWTPVQPALIRPDILGDEHWVGGFDYGWQDAEKRLAYGFMLQKFSGLWRNTDLVKDGELTSVSGLLDPKWRGKMIFGEPWSYGPSYRLGTVLRLKHGDEILKRLFVDQQTAFTRDVRQVAEGLVRGTYAIGITSEESVAEFHRQGLCLTITDRGSGPT